MSKKVYKTWGTCCYISFVPLHLSEIEEDLTYVPSTPMLSKRNPRQKVAHTLSFVDFFLFITHPCKAKHGLKLFWKFYYYIQKFTGGTHHLFTIMNTQKKGNLQFCFPGLLGIYRNPSVKIQIMGGKHYLRCEGKTLLGIVNKLFVFKFVDNAQQCFAFTPQAMFLAHNLNFYWRWRWWDWIQATF